MTMDNRCREIGVMPADRCKISPRTVSAQKAAPGVIDVALV
ncbi:hypothetical protein [Hoeflea sp.]|nr:hypothetical protein [Hoeflea sp.]